MAFKNYTFEIKRAKSESMTCWINRSDEALMDMRKKLASAPGANSSESTRIPPQIQGWLATSSQSESAMSRHCWSHDHDKRQSEYQTVEESLLDLFTDDVFQFVDRSHGKDWKFSKATHFVRHVNNNDSDDDVPYVDEDGNFLAKEDDVSDVDDDFAIGDEGYNEALLGHREVPDLMNEARVARRFCPVVVPNRSDKHAGRGKGESSGLPTLVAAAR